MLTIALPIASLTACDKITGKDKARAAASASAAAAASAAALAASQAAAASASAAAAAAASAQAAANAAAIEKAKNLVADLKWMIAHNVTQNPAKAGEGDASTKCNAVETSQKALTPATDPELKKHIEEAVALCAFDIPLTTAIEALDHLRFTPSQASRRLMCDVALKELEKARAVKPKDTKLRGVDARRKETCLR